MNPSPAHATSQVDVRNLNFSFTLDRAPLFMDFKWQVSRGETWAIVGPSGCGKTTLLYLLAGLRRPDSGEVLIGGTSVRRPRAATGLILQDHGLLPWATVRQNAGLGLRIGHFYRGKQPRNGEPRPYPPDLPLSVADQWLERLGLGPFAAKYPSQLSGGQRQRVAIARALALQPDLLLMDEPFNALDPATRQDLQDLVADLQQELGITTILVTHSIEEAAYLGEKILVLNQPPNRNALILHNPGAGDPAHRHSPAYLATTQQLQLHLGAAVPA